MLKLFPCLIERLVFDLKSSRSIIFFERSLHLFQHGSENISKKIDSLYSLCLQDRKNLFNNLSAINELTAATTLSKNDFLKLFRLLLLLRSKVREEFYYYVNKDSVKILCMRLLKDIDDFTIYDIFIFTNIFYRLNVKLPQEECILLSQFFINKSANATLDNIIEFIKFVRLGPFQEDILLFLQSKLENEIGKLNFMQIPHVLAGFSTYAYYQPEFCEKLIKHGFNLLEDQKKDIRCKDFTRFVWCLAMFNYSIDEKISHLITSTIKQLKSQFFCFHNKTIDCLKSLAILGIYEKSLFELFLNDSHLIKLCKHVKKFKVPQDLNFLLKSIEIESPEINIKSHDKIRSITRSSNEKIDGERSELFSSLVNCLNDACVIYPLPHVLISSIYSNNCIYEVLDQSVLLRGPLRKYNGYFNCKLRQMEKKGLTFKMISSKEDIENLNSSIFIC